MGRRKIETAPEDQASYPAADKGYIDLGCEEPRCGQPQEGPGHPRRGWVQVKGAGCVARWFCSYYCAGKYGIRRALRGEA